MPSDPLNPSLDDIASMTHGGPGVSGAPAPNRFLQPFLQQPSWLDQAAADSAANAAAFQQGGPEAVIRRPYQSTMDLSGGFGNVGLTTKPVGLFGHPELNAEFAKMDPATQELAKAWMNKKPGSGEAEKILNKVFNGSLSDKLIDQWDSFTDKWSEHQEIESALETLKDYNTGSDMITPYELSNAFETLQNSAGKMSPMQQTKFWQSYENIEPGNLPTNHKKAADAIQDVLHKKLTTPKLGLTAGKPAPTLDLQSNEAMAATKDKWAAKAPAAHAEWEKIQQLLKDPSKLTQKEYDAALDAEERLMGQHSIHPDEFIPHFQPLDWASKKAPGPGLGTIARQQRAQEQGFNLNFPLYKGASEKGYWKELPDPITKPNERATFFSDNPKIAGHYGSVENYVARAEKPMTIDWKAATGGLATYSSEHMRPMLDAARKLGVDMLEIRNIEDIGGKQTQYAVLHPRILRAPGAQFDPAMMQHAMPLAGLAGGVIFLDQYGNVIPQRKDQ